MGDGATTSNQLPPLSNGQKWAVGIALPVSLALAVMAFTEMFKAVRDAMVPVAGGLAWTIPVGTDAGMVVFSLLDMLFETIESHGRRVRPPWLPWMTRLLIVMQLAINISTATTGKGRLGRAVLPVIFVGVIEIWRYYWRHRTAASAKQKTRRDKIPSARWLADLGGTWALRRLMILWNIMDIGEALVMLQKIQLAEATLHRVYGKSWHAETDADLLFRLRTAEFLDEACAAIAKLGDGKRRELTSRRETPAGKPPAPANASASDCCGVHQQITVIRTSGRKLPFTDDAAAEMNRAHMEAHGSPIGAETLLKLFPIGSDKARTLRDQLRGSGRPVGSVGPAGRAGQSGPVGSAQPGLVGSVNGSGG